MDLESRELMLDIMGDKYVTLIDSYDELTSFSDHFADYIKSDDYHTPIVPHHFDRWLWEVESGEEPDLEYYRAWDLRYK